MTASATMRAMIALGLTDEQKLTLLDAIDADAGPSRTAGAERQRRYRERKKAGVTGDATRDGNERDAEPSPLCPPLKVSPDPYKQPPPISPQPPSGGGAREAFFRLPVDWVPTRPLPANLQAKVDQWPPGEIEDELAAFHRWALNAENKPGKGRKKDWDTAWHNWLDRKHKDHRRNGHRKPDHRQAEHQWGRTVAAADALIDELRAGAAGHG